MNNDMATIIVFLLGALAVELLTASIGLIVTGCKRYLNHRAWLLAGETSPLPVLETAHSAL